ncbi:MAG: hypothetical protein HP491_06395 [Nitrospira sp.]|nr:hypothetical protein [Nitrospira sp.]
MLTASVQSIQEPHDPVTTQAADIFLKDHFRQISQREPPAQFGPHKSARCTECVGHFDEPQCAAVCPVDNCCISDPLYPEPTAVLLDRAKQLNPDKTIDPAKIWSGVRN